MPIKPDEKAEIEAQRSESGCDSPVPRAGARGNSLHAICPCSITLCPRHRHMGDDGAVVAGGRVSYGKGTKRVNEDKGLIQYLIATGHHAVRDCEIITM